MVVLLLWCRPGRIDRKVEFGLPDLEGRTKIFQVKPNLAIHRSPPVVHSRQVSRCVQENQRGGRFLFARVLRCSIRPVMLDSAALLSCLLAHVYQIHSRTMNVERDIRFELLARLCPNNTVRGFKDFRS